MNLLKLLCILFLLLNLKIAIADEHPESITFSCKVLRHVQVLRTVVTHFDRFEFEVIVKKEAVILTDRFFYGATNLEFSSKDSDDEWLASDGINRFKLDRNYLYITRLDGVGVKSLSAYCKRKKFK